MLIRQSNEWGKVIIISFLAILLTIVGGVIACGSGPLPTANESAIRAYADPATEITLQGLSESNLTKYTQYANSKFKSAVTQDLIDKTAIQINNQLGTYVSKEFLAWISHIKPGV